MIARAGFSIGSLRRYGRGQQKRRGRVSPRVMATSMASPCMAQYRPPSTGKSRNSAVDATTHGAVIE